MISPRPLVFVAGIAALCFAFPAPAQQAQPIAIGAVQGAVGDGDEATRHATPMNDRTVTIRGVVHQFIMGVSREGRPFHAFLIQDKGDNNPETSDGIFVFLGGRRELRSSEGNYAPKVGDDLLISGRATEFSNQTQLASPTLVKRFDPVADLNAALPPIKVDPPNNEADAARYWERLEGMRVEAPAGSVVVAPRHVYASSMDAEAWLIAPTALAGRTDPFARRVFRDPHPLDNDPALFDDGNGYRFLIGSGGIKGAKSDPKAMIDPVRSLQALEKPAIGGVTFGFGKYVIQIAEPLALSSLTDPAKNGAPSPADRASEFTVATFNLENLYDAIDDPFDGADFAGNPGSGSIRPPFNYVPESDAVYQERLAGLARQIVEDLHAPDVLLVQEIEDQDIAKVVSGKLVFGSANNADGRPDNVQELIAKIAAIGGPAYDSAFDRNAADERGITTGFIYRTDRVELAKPEEAAAIFAQSPAIDYPGTAAPYNADKQNPKALNSSLPAGVRASDNEGASLVYTRAAHVALFKVWKAKRGEGEPAMLWAINNHFSSIPDQRVEQRIEQARYAAAIASAILKSDPAARVIVGGDLNVYPRPDDPFAPGHRQHPSDQLGSLYEAGLFNVFDHIVKEAPSAAYTYIYNGQAQTLDHLFLSPKLRESLVQARPAHINSDWAESPEGEARAMSDHDPVVARLRF